LKRSPYVLTDEKMTEIQGDILENPNVSVRKLSQQVDIPKTTVHTALRSHLGLYPFRTTVTHQLLPGDHEARKFFCEWISDVCHNDTDFLNRCFFSDEAWFYLDGFVNSQNSRQWNNANPHLIIERPLHPLKIGVWCAMSAKRLFYVFFNYTVTTEHYLSFIHQFIATLTEDEIFTAWFQQDNAPAHTSNKTLSELKNYFADRTITKGLWPPRSPDLSPPDYFLWGFLKGKVYQDKPRTVNDLKRNIAHAFSNISPGLLYDGVHSLLQRSHMCILVDGQHFQHL
jgi:hypothetical protein